MECEYTAKLESNLQNHVERNHTFNYDDCKYTVKSQVDVETHEREMHWTCDQCNFEAKVVNSLTYHQYKKTWSSHIFLT